MELQKGPTMSRSSSSPARGARRAVLASSVAVVLGSATLASGLAAGAAAATKKARLPVVATGNVTHVHGTSGLLQGSVNPRGSETMYFFEYGPTLLYGSVTPSVSAGNGSLVVKVGQTVNNLKPGYHYRLVASNEAGRKNGLDKVFTTSSSSRMKFTMASTKEQPPTPYGGTFTLRGTLAGLGGVPHTISVESSPFPYLTPFAQVGLPLKTSASGTFAFQVPNLKQSTQLRVATADARPVISPTVLARVSVKVTLKVRSAGQKGLYRLYGTVTPAKVGAPVLFQLEKAARPRGEAETAVRWTTRANTVVKRGTKTVSRFSNVVKVTRGGRYRAFVQLGRGALVSGWSPSVTLHAAPAKKRK